MPTRAGWGVLFGGVAFVVAGRLFGAIEFLVVGVAALAAGLAAVALRHIHPSRVAVARSLTPPQVPAGEPARVDLEIINRSRSRTPVMHLHDAVTGTRGVNLAIAPIAADGGTVQGAYRLPTSRRGVLDLGPIEITDTDGLGLARRRHRLDTRVRLVVHPPIEALPPVRVPAGDDPLLGEELRQSLGLSDEEFDGLREYVPGDDLRKIHWPSSARHDELQVRQFRPPRHGRLSIVIDTRPPGDTVAALDRTTSIAGSIAAAVLEAGDATRIETTDGRSTPLVSGRSQLDALLEFLALLDDGDDDIHPSTPSGSGTVVAVSADPQIANDIAARRRLAVRLRAAIVITVGVEGWGAPGAEPTTAGDWIHITGPDQLASTWRLGRSTYPAGAPR
ncbi:MAG: DUF58 domain-containing protein [Actinomycetota bacterium]